MQETQQNAFLWVFGKHIAIVQQLLEIIKVNQKEKCKTSEIDMKSDLFTETQKQHNITFFITNLRQNANNNLTSIGFQ